MIEDKVKTFKALSDQNRLRILKMLQERILCVCEITEVLQLAASTVSSHLSILRDSGFILEEKDGKWVNYKINSRPSDPTIASILSMIHLWIGDDDIIRKDKEKVIKVDRKILCCK